MTMNEFEKCRVLSDCMISCLICAQHAEKEEMDCVENCRYSADCCYMSIKCLARNFEEKEWQMVMQANEMACQNCHDLCIKHDNEHCQRCAESCKKAVHLLKSLKKA